MTEQVEIASNLMELKPLPHSTSSTVLMKPLDVLCSNGFYSAGLPASSFPYRFVKRFADFAAAGLLLIIMAPLILAIAVAVRLSSPGPVFYREKRVGRFGKHFTILKFRSMYTQEYLDSVLNYREDEHVQMKRRIDKKHERDPRVTRVGSILRTLSFDELPQLINVLKGDMSLVGPRPVVEAELQHYGDRVMFYKLMYPGVSGLWQVSGRNDVDYQTRVSLDVKYCMNWSPLLDMTILARTLPAVLYRRGAY